MSFDLTKWYLDCVTPEGEVFIGYAAHLRWNSVAIPYHSRLHSRAGERVQAKSALCAYSEPAIANGTLAWHCANLGVSGSWCGVVQSERVTLFDSESGIAEWNCAMPSARATIQVGDAKPLEGLGYVEYLRMTIPPWQLPIRQLRWGRFLSASDSLVWIEWCGPRPLQYAALNGKLQDSLKADSSGVEVGEGRLAFEDCVTLQCGSIGESLSPALRPVQRALPASILNLHEEKFLSRACLRRSNGSSSSGWAVHEVVRWP